LNWVPAIGHADPEVINNSEDDAMDKSHAPESPSAEATDIYGFPLVDDKGDLVTKDRRRSERRRWGAKPNYPLVDSKGDVVTQNRRRVVERRILKATAGSGPTAALQRGPALVVRFDGGVWELAGDSELLLLGRRDECQLRVSNKFVSRDHARVEAVEDGFLLTDSSSNGTFVRFDDGEVHDVFRKSLQLRGSGVLRLGRPVEDGADDLIRFRVRD
jgi:hypothetical protein